PQATNVGGGTLAIKAGVAAEKVQNIGYNKRPGTLTTDEALVYGTIRELIESGTLSDATRIDGAPLRSDASA
ncbi:MAG: hypothetical protein ACREFO_21285, partial [Acetobacteraceae bacterium]